MSMVLAQAQGSFEKTLARITLADIVAEIREKSQ
jgi:DNA-binding IscR family transcriptional regulator